MKTSTRILITTPLLEAALLAVMVYGILQVKGGPTMPPDQQAETIRRLTTVLGGAMGGIAVLMGVLFVRRRRQGD